MLYNINYFVHIKFRGSIDFIILNDGLSSVNGLTNRLKDTFNKLQA